MAFVAAYSTNSVFKSHNIRHHLEHPCLWQCQISPLMLTQHVSDTRTRKRVSSQHPLLLSLHHLLRLSPISNSSRFLLPCPPLPLLYRFCSPPFSSPMFSLSSTNDSDAALDAKTVRAVIKGRVQGVFYRDWTVENAKELGLKGWVRNRRDGTVEALFSGSPEKVHEMEQRCQHGPPAAIVSGFNVFPCNDDPGTGFERRQTA